nr:hypothetical protein [Tanacetum cinerariifolium]
MRMEKRGELMVELEKLAISKGATQYLEVLCHKQDMDGEKYQLLRQLLRMARDETYEMQLAMEFPFSYLVCCFELVSNPLAKSFVDCCGSSSVGSGVAAEDVCSRSSCGRDVADSSSGRRNSGCEDELKTSSRLNASGRERVSLFSMVFTSSLQFGAKVMCLRTEASDSCDACAVINDD